MKKCFQIAAILSLSSLTISQGCVDITGIGNNTGDLVTLEYLKDNDWPLDGVFSAFVLPMASQRDPNVLDLRETPIQFRFLIYELLSIYNTLSMYDEVAYEFFAREDIMSSRRRCQPDVFNTEEFELFNYHRSVAMAYSICFMIPHLLPENVETATEILDSFGMYYDICDIANCDDISTPWGLAYTVFAELADYGEFDGWNEYGNYDREYNKIPFSDFRDDDTRYTPVNTPWDISDINRWQPLLESDGLGFLYYQEHVTSHIGYTGKSFIYTDDEFCQRSKDFQSDSDNFPNYDYDEEMELAFDRLRDLTDIQKMLVETFDSKGVLNGFRVRVVSTAWGFGRDSMYYIAVNLLNHLSLYEGALAVWKEKVDFDAIRPPSIVHELLAGTQIESYAGTTVDGETYGTQTFDANDWEPYIRTMPHAEYPSGSSCVCKAWANAHIDLLGIDEFPVTQTLTYSALSSDYEPLSTPASEVSQDFNSFTDVADICGQSRLWGGMHFTKSVEAGEDLCGDIGTRVADVVGKLFNGQAPDYVIDINDHGLIHRDCYPDQDFYDSSSSSSKSSSSSRSRSKSSSSKSSSKSGSSSRSSSGNGRSSSSSH